MKVILHKLFPYAPYLNEYIGFEDELMPMENYLQAVERLRGYAEEAHRKRYPNLYPNGSEAMIESFAPPITQIEKRDTVDNIIEDINSCKELKVLETYKLIAKTNERIMNAYNEKLKTFNNE